MNILKNFRSKLFFLTSEKGDTLEVVGDTKEPSFVRGNEMSRGGGYADNDMYEHSSGSCSETTYLLDENDQSLVVNTRDQSSVTINGNQNCAASDDRDQGLAMSTLDQSLAMRTNDKRLAGDHSSATSYIKDQSSAMSSVISGSKKVQSENISGELLEHCLTFQSNVKPVKNFTIDTTIDANHDKLLTISSLSPGQRSRESSVSSQNSTRSSSPKLYKCPQPDCYRSYNRPSLLEQHLKTHSGERNFHCPHPGCGKSFFRSFHLKVHMYSHSSEKLLHCSICGKGFNTNQHLKRHEKVHTLSHECPYSNCTAAFHRHSALAKHILKSHQQKWEFPCPHSDCNAGFDKAIKLSKHLANDHSNIPTYNCTHNCSEKFFTWSALQAHIKSSHEKVPCSLCGKLCSGPAAVTQHMKTHNPSPQVWECRIDTCMENPIFETKAELAAHYQYVHEYVPSKLRGALINSNSSNKDIAHKDIDSITNFKEVIVEQGAKSFNENPLQCSKAIKRGSAANKHNKHMLIENLSSTTGTSLNGLGDSDCSESSTSSKRRRLTENSSVISLISGSGYEKTRKLPCTVTGCNYKFARSYDLERHLKSFHAEKIVDVSVVDMNECSSQTSATKVLSTFEVVNVDNEDSDIDPLLK